MKAKKLFPDLSFKRLWNKIKDLEDKVENDSGNSNETVRYNPETDMVEIYYNDVWQEWKVAGMQKFDFIKQTILSNWTLTKMKLTYPSTDLVDSIKFVTSSIESGASTTLGKENCYAICEIPIMIKKGDKLKINTTGTETGGNWLTISISNDGVNFNVLAGELYSTESEFDLTTYAGSELYFKVGFRSASVQVTHTFTKFEISQ